MTSMRSRDSSFFETLSFTRLFFLALALVVMHLSSQVGLRDFLGGELPASLASSIVLMVGFPFLLVRLLRGNPLVVFRIQSLRPSALGLLTLLTVAAVLPIDALTALNTHFVPVPDDVGQILSQLQPHGFNEWAIAVAAAAVAAPLGEEIVFRGMLQQSAMLFMRPFEAVVLCAFLFAAVHLQSYYLLGLLGVGVILGVVFLRTANLTAAVYVHGLYNLISLLALATGNGEEESILDKPLGWPLAVAGFVVVIWALRRLGSDATVESTWKTGRGAGPD